MADTTSSIILTPEQEAYTKKLSFTALLLGPFYYYIVNGFILRALCTLIPFYNIYVWIHGFLYGRRLVWERGEWVSFESYKKRQILVGRIGIALVGIAVILGIIISMTISQAFGPMTTAINSFFAATANGDTTTAYNQMADASKQSESLEEFDTFVKGNAQLFSGKQKLSNWSSSGDQAEVKGTTTEQDGTVVPVDINLVNEHGEWRVLGVQWSVQPQTPSAQ